MATYRADARAKLAMATDKHRDNSTTRPAVLLTLSPSRFPGVLPSLQQRFTVLRLDEAADPSSFIALHSPSIVALVAIHAPSHLIHCLPNLRLISCPGVGLDEVDLQTCRERGISVTNVPAISSGDVADLAILLMLAVFRRLPAADRQANGKGIVGLGKIGLAIAKRAEAFGCGISYQGRSRKPNVPYMYYSDVLDLSINSDVIFVSCALNNETHHLINRDVLNALGPDGTLVNIARGPIVDEVELIAALKEGRLGSCALDVFEHEPHVPMELCEMDNVVLTPHMGNATSEIRSAMADLIVANVEAFFSGKPLITPVF